MVEKYVYSFGGGKADGKTELKNLLGGKGANLAEMTNLGINVPPGFTITTNVCTLYYENNENYPEGLDEQVEEALSKVEGLMGKEFGDVNDPLLFSVRSGARVSMPGMMDTVLNLGLNDETVQGVIKQTNNERFAYDSYRRFVQMFGNVVLGMDGAEFEEILEKKKEKLGVDYDTEIPAESLKELVGEFKAHIKETTGEDFPEEPKAQLWAAIDAVFGSWNNERAISYRNINDIPHHWGTAVNVQTMVYGNMGENSGTGVAFTRNPSTGENKYWGEYLKNAQGEDVVAGIRTPKPIAQLEEEMPEIYKQLTDIFEKLEKHYTDVQDVEFTIQEGELFMLQTRTGKRTARAAVKIAVDLEEEGLIDKRTAVGRIEPQKLDELLHRRIDPDAELTILAKGLDASPGAAAGKVVFDSDEAAELGKAGEKVVLVRTETSPEDIHGMAAAQGVLTSRGGMTSHAAVVARGMGKPAVAGCEDIKVDYSVEKFTTPDGTVVKKGDFITIDGGTGNVYLGEVPTIDPEMDENFEKLMGWADDFRTMQVRTNADTPEDAEAAVDFGAEGIGLCRTEHMFFDEDRLPIVQDMILADSKAARESALEKLLPMQKGDFKGILKAMGERPVTIRLLDPPLHEFLPDHDELLVEVTKLKAGGKDASDKEELLKTIENLHEMNPMLGHRGCRLGVTYPEIYEMQAKAIMEAACELKADGLDVHPEIMIPLVAHINEFKLMKGVVKKAADAVIKEAGVDLSYTIGTMIELPRAALTADQIAEEAEFFSFGTNDLTQTTFGFSRDDAEGKFLAHYLDEEVLEKNPFQVLDQDGVGQLVEIGVNKGRSSNPNLKVGICGEHGGEPSSVKFCHSVGLNYVSCSPFRVPIARLAAAQAEVNNPHQ
ncbi:pyruvate, phosphate dikinase [Iocasia frigidifontis]|uniref:Pyruvate, phosphate dikinase n=1 Tax=Iocasia fonsfrigidae TaxID=2682810 RepID=A0A8A7KAW7_9FIRM|nr:pyruvate, phosphate dikinase [Iocasia fonsfrigidae]QTL98983.1 pyruvate, phosphate dikinase [Iocasia fonsfrigidae]